MKFSKFNHISFLIFIISLSFQVNSEEICGFTPINKGDKWVYQGHIRDFFLMNYTGYDSLTKEIQIVDVKHIGSDTIQYCLSVKDSGYYTDPWSSEEPPPYHKCTASVYIDTGKFIRGRYSYSWENFTPLCFACSQHDSCDGEVIFNGDTLLYELRNSYPEQALIIENYGLIYYQFCDVSSHGNGDDDFLKLVRYNDKNVNSDSLFNLVTTKIKGKERIVSRNQKSNVMLTKKEYGISFFNSGKSNVQVELFDLKGSLLLRKEILPGTDLKFHTQRKGVFVARLDRNPLNSLKIQL